MENETIDFKVDDEYFHAEKDGVKNNTVRIIDMKDERFHKLMRMWKSGSYGVIRETLSQFTSISYRAGSIHKDEMHSFMRQIRHIAILGLLMIITWEHDKNE